MNPVQHIKLYFLVIQENAKKLASISGALIANDCPQRARHV